ncbi:phage tail protein [Idiomarina abyssalis]|uniref:phage tail protein n=1 Tax=Idiomarina abyssalis TaxID=86102 RepID=UPI001CD74C83|nr:phage tail protein [Idiomarina abyssalis]
MNKPGELRDIISSAVPHLKKNPDTLHIFIDKGNLYATGAGHNLSFEYQFDCVVLVTDYRGHSDDIMVPILAWVARHQPELINNRDKRDNGITFRAELINKDTADIEVTIKMTEPVKVTNDGSGNVVEHLPEPPFDPYDGFDWELYIQGVKVDDTSEGGNG